MDRSRCELLQLMPVFGGVSSKTVMFLVERATCHTLEEGEYFFHEGDTASSMFVIESGSVSVVKTGDGKSYTVRELESGDCFGEMALIDLYPRSSSIVATSRCSAIEIGQTSLFRLHEEDMEQFTIIQMNIGREISRRLRMQDEQLFHSTSKHA